MPDVPLLTAAGEPAPALQDALVNVLVFFRPGQERSLAGLRELARCQAQFDAGRVRWTAIVSGSVPQQAAAQVLAASGFAGPLRADPGDRLYGLLGVAMHPVAVVVDRKRSVAAFEPFRSLEFCTVVAAGIRAALDETPAAPPQEAFSPATPAASAQARHYRALGEALAQRGNCAGAARAFERALALDSGDAAAREGLARCAGAR